jgi:monoamine oxidase
MFDAIIVGAGIAGLNTAWRLQHEGQSVLVLEARDRVGGRLLSLPVADASPVDLGATWIWPAERHVMALVRELGLEIFTQHDSGRILYDVRGGDVQAVPGAPGSAPSLRVQGGPAMLAKAIHERLAPGTVRLETKVMGVEARGADELAVLLDGQPEQTAKHVVIALPPALAMHSIAFDPALPEELERVASSTPVWMGSIVKTVAVYASPFWRTAGFSGTALSNAGPLQEVHDHCGAEARPAALFGFTSVDPPAIEAPSREAVLHQLVRLFGPEAGHPLEFLQRDWSRSEFTSPPGVGRLQNHELFGHPVFARAALGGRLHFSSAETSGAQGHIEDALAASARTVERL